MHALRVLISLLFRIVFILWLWQAIVARGFLARITVASVLDFRRHIHNGSEMRSRLVVHGSEAPNDAERNPFSVIFCYLFIYFFATDGCVAASAACDSRSVEENRAIVASVIQGLTFLFNC